MGATVGLNVAPSTLGDAVGTAVAKVGNVVGVAVAGDKQSEDVGPAQVLQEGSQN